MVTLKDVYRITRLPIKGKLVNMAPILSMKWAKKWAMWFIISKEINHRKRMCFLLWHVPKDPPTWYDLRLRLLITYLLNIIIYLDKSNETFPMGMIPIIWEMVLHRQWYAWFLAILMQLYHDLHSFVEVERGGR